MQSQCGARVSRCPGPGPGEYGFVGKGVFRQPRQDHIGKQERRVLASPCMLSELDTSRSSVGNQCRIDKLASLSAILLKKLGSTNTMGPPKRSAAKLRRTSQGYPKGMRSPRVMEKFPDCSNYIHLSTITINGEIPTSGALVEKIRDASCRTFKMAATQMPRHTSSVSTTAAVRPKKISRGIQPRRIKTAAAETQHETIVTVASSQYEPEYHTVMRKSVCTQVNQREPPRERKLTREEILDLLRSTYTTADVGVNVQPRPPRPRPAAMQRSKVSQPPSEPPTTPIPIPAPPPPRQRPLLPVSQSLASRRLAFSKEMPRCEHASFRDIFNHKKFMQHLFRRKSSSKEFLDCVSASQSGSEMTTTPSTDSQDDDLSYVKRSNCNGVKKPMRRIGLVSKIPRIITPRRSKKLYEHSNDRIAPVKKTLMEGNQ